MWVIKAEQLKSSYVLDMYGTRKVVQAVNEVDLEIRQSQIPGD